MTNPTTPDVEHPEARGKQAILGHLDHALTGNQQRTVVDAPAGKSAAWAERPGGAIMHISQHG